ncbi:hypothetical protein T10_3313 [Trichinella papuae]|uniref:Uncharacterized protein n=1 Tax=Trichinella papuae TaxID=268474 RepID=A0A0V1MM29_9BILA|nr:hypothetical protein T10_3313 [Trichinella papuae]
MQCCCASIFQRLMYKTQDNKAKKKKKKHWNGVTVSCCGRFTFRLLSMPNQPASQKGSKQPLVQFFPVWINNADNRIVFPILGADNQRTPFWLCVVYKTCFLLHLPTLLQMETAKVLELLNK